MKHIIPKENGFYWFKDKNGWQPVEVKDGEAFYLGDRSFKQSDCLESRDEFGPAIVPPSIPPAIMEITADGLRQWLLHEAGEIQFIQHQNTVADSLYALCKKVDEAMSVYHWHHNAVTKSDKAP